MDRRKRKELTRRWLTRLLPPLVTLVIRLTMDGGGFGMHKEAAADTNFYMGLGNRSALGC